MSSTYEPSAYRTQLVMTHLVHAMTIGLVSLAVVLAWLADTHPWPSTVIGIAMVLTYLWSRSNTWALLLLVAFWTCGCLLAPSFVWVAFALYFVCMIDLPRWHSLAAMAVIAGYSVWVSNSLVGPVMGAVTAAAIGAVFALQNRDAEAYRQLLAELREAQDDLIAGEHDRGVLAERERLAREIHDTIAQGLSSIVVLTRTAHSTNDLQRVLDTIESTARDNLAEARRLVHDLGTPEDIGLAESLRVVVADANRQALVLGMTIHVELTCEGIERTLPADLVLALHRACAASVANVLQHAHASRCVVGLSWFDDRVVIDVVDNGQGFDQGKVRPGSFGIRGARSRLAEFGGTLHIDSVLGQGTTIALSVPCPNHTAEEPK